MKDSRGQFDTVYFHYTLETMNQKLTCKSNSWNSVIVAENNVVVIDPIMSSSTYSKYPRTEGRHALWWRSSIACRLDNKYSSFDSWKKWHIYRIEKSCEPRWTPIGSDGQTYNINTVLSCLWIHLIIHTNVRWSLQLRWIHVANIHACQL